MLLNWLYLALIVGQSIDPSYLMINRWCCEAILGSEDIGSGCYLSMLAISLRPRITRNLKFLLAGTSLGIEYMKQGKYIGGDDRRGYKLAEVNLPLSDMRLKLFIEGRQNCADKEEQKRNNYRRRIINRGPQLKKKKKKKNKRAHPKLMCHHMKES
jgi:hypothetical protein